MCPLPENPTHCDYVHSILFHGGEVSLWDWFVCEGSLFLAAMIIIVVLAITCSWVYNKIRNFEHTNKTGGKQNEKRLENKEKE